MRTLRSVGLIRASIPVLAVLGLLLGATSVASAASTGAVDSDAAGIGVSAMPTQDAESDDASVDVQTDRVRWALLCERLASSDLVRPIVQRDLRPDRRRRADRSPVGGVCRRAAQAEGRVAAAIVERLPRRTSTATTARTTRTWCAGARRRPRG